MGMNGTTGAAMLVAAGLTLAAAASCGAAPRGMGEAFMTGFATNASAHVALNPHFAKAFAFLKRGDLATIRPGRYDLDGEACYATVSEGDLVPFAGKTQTAEFHRRYIDIQMGVDGPMAIGLCDLKGCAVAPSVPYDATKDYGLVDIATEPVTLAAGEYVILMPGRGAHAPGRTMGAPVRRRKVVVKVLASPALPAAAL